ncbi:MAG TPA: TIGR01777 family oxidoreductase [Solirubrobacteraceae bacterium]|nr:TIGR01777 family oxidoreductase [Solirubrobacteraceae bacterium]
MRLTLTGATGRIGRSIVEAASARGDELTVLTRSPERAASKLPQGVEALAWDPKGGPAPATALSGRDAVIHLAGEDVAQRWSDRAKQEIRESRELGTRNLVAGIAAAEPRPTALVSASAAGYYGARGDEPVDETAPPADDFLAGVVVAWEREARRAEELGVRVALMRTGVVLSADAGALKKMLPPFRLGVGGPVGGGRQYIPWVHLDDVVGMYLEAAGDERWSGPVNVVAPGSVTNKEFSKALGKALHRPAVAPVPGLALKLLYGEMSQIVLTGARMAPTRAQALGYAFRHPRVQEALEATV